MFAPESVALRTSDSAFAKFVSIFELHAICVAATVTFLSLIIFPMLSSSITTTHYRSSTIPSLLSAHHTYSWGSTRIVRPRSTIFRLAGRESLSLVRKVGRPFIDYHDKVTNRSLKDDIGLPEDGYPPDEQTESESYFAELTIRPHRLETIREWASNPLQRLW